MAVALLTTRLCCVCASCSERWPVRLCAGKPKETNYIPPAPPEDEDELFKTIEAGINFDKYDKIPVKSTGSNVPKPIDS